MGLRDFFKKGDETPKAQPTGTGKNGPASGGFFGNDANKQTTPQGTTNDIYTVASGDSLSKIAKKHYGDANAWHKIYEANKAEIGDNPDLIKPGQRFVIPK